MSKTLVLICAVAIIAVASYRKKNLENERAAQGGSNDIPPAGSAETSESNGKYIVIYKASDLDVDGVSNAISEIFEYDYGEAEAIAKRQTAILQLFDTKEEAEDAVETLDGWEVSAEYLQMKDNLPLSGRNIFRIDNAFNVNGRGTIVTGVEHMGSIKKGQAAYLIKKNGSAILTKVSEIEIFKDKIEETREGVNCGLLLDNVSKDQIEAGDIVMAI